jgi:hypothetical protein
MGLHFARPHADEFADIELFHGLASLGEVEFRILPNELAGPPLVELIDLEMPPAGRMARRYYRKIPTAELINVVCHDG